MLGTLCCFAVRWLIGLLYCLSVSGVWFGWFAVVVSVVFGYVDSVVYSFMLCDSWCWVLCVIWWFAFGCYGCLAGLLSGCAG